MEGDNVENVNGNFGTSPRSRSLSFSLSDIEHVLTDQISNVTGTGISYDGNFGLNDATDSLLIVDLKPGLYNSRSLTVRVLHQWQGSNENSPSQYLLSDSSGWIDAIHFGNTDQKNLFKTYLKKNKCFIINNFRVLKRSDKFSSFSGHPYQINLTETKLGFIEEAAASIDNCRTYMPFQFSEFTSLHCLLSSPPTTACPFKYDVIGVIAEVHDIDKTDVGNKSRTIMIKNSRKPDGCVNMKCVLYGALADFVNKRQVGSVMVLKNAKVVIGVDVHSLWISDSQSCAFNIKDDTDAEIISVGERNKYYDPIKPTTRKRKSAESSSTAQNTPKRICDTKASDFKHFKVTSIKNIIRGSKNHKMTDMKVTLENLFMTWTKYYYIGCTECGKKLTFGSHCPCHPSIAAAEIFLATDIILYQEDFKLSEIGDMKACFGAQALKINELESDGNGNGKKVPRIQVKGSKSKAEKKWNFKITSVSDDVQQQEGSPHSPEASAPEEIENRNQHFTNLNPLEVKVVKYEPGLHTRDERNSYSINSTPKGALLIVNNKNFIFDELGNPDDGSNNRQFTEVDVNNMQRVFTQLGYDVQYKADLTIEDMKRELVEFQTYVAALNVDIVLVCVMSHGKRDVIQMTDGFLHIWNDIVYKFRNENFPQMAGKPKGFFLQCCQNFPTPAVTLRGPDYTEIHHTQPWDTFVSFSSAPGFLSTRYEGLGSIYIYKLVEIIMKQSHQKDLNSMFEQLKNEMKQYRESQVTNEDNFLGKLLYLQ